MRSHSTETTASLSESTIDDDAETVRLKISLNNANSESSDEDQSQTMLERYSQSILNLRDAEFDIYCILAFQAKISLAQKPHIAPFKLFIGLVPEEWSSYQMRWFNSYYVALLHCIMCWCIQTVGLTATLSYQFIVYYQGILLRIMYFVYLIRWWTIMSINWWSAYDLAQMNRIEHGVSIQRKVGTLGSTKWWHFYGLQWFHWKFMEEYIKHVILDFIRY